MSVILRHPKFPVLVVYKDPQKNWDEIVKDRLVEEIQSNGFESFTVIDWEKAASFLGVAIPQTEEATEREEEL